MWYAKMYFSEKKEVFQFDSHGVQGVPSTYRELPFLESLLSFLETDCKELEPLLRRAYGDWSLLIDRDDKEAGVRTLMDLGDLGGRHIYLHLLYVRWFERFGRMGITQDRGSREDQEMLEELQGLPKQLPLYQQQVQRFFDLVLDVDKAGRDPQQQASAHYLYDAPKDPSLFSFRPIPLSFEPVEPGRCSPVLYPFHISDMIDYSLRSCVERGITVRRARTADGGSPRQAGSARSTVSVRCPEDSRPAVRLAPSSSGPRSSPTIRCSRPTARSTKSALPGSRPVVSPTSSSTPGANRPER